MIGELRPEHAELLVKHHLLEYPLETLNFFKDVIKNLYTTAIYKSDDMAVPVSWMAREMGCVHGFRYTHKDHRQLGLNNVTMYYGIIEGLARGEVVFGHFNNINTLPPQLYNETFRAKAIIMQ